MIGETNKRQYNNNKNQNIIKKIQLILIQFDNNT